MLPINDDSKKVSFTFYHFDKSKSIILTEVKKNIGESATSNKAEAAVSANKPLLSFKSGKLDFNASTTYFIQDKKLTSTIKSASKHKHTFILTDKSSQHAIGYAPNVSEEELAFALKKHMSSSKVNFTSAIILDTGNQCGFYKHNGPYNPYYLKELKKPSKVLLIK